MSYYEDLLEELHRMEGNVMSVTPSLMDEIQTLKLEVRYILPYVRSGLVTEEGGYEEIVLLRYKMKNDEFVHAMTHKTLLVKPDATEFYCSNSLGEYDWLKCFDYVLDNLKYIQSQDVAAKEQIKASEEKLRFIRTLFMLVTKWNFKKLDIIETRLHEFGEDMKSVSRLAAYFFRLFVDEAPDESKVEVELSEVSQRINSAQVRAVEVYYGILGGLKLSLSNSCNKMGDTLCSFIDSLASYVEKISRSLHPSKESVRSELHDILLELNFLRTTLYYSSKESIGNGIIDGISTHIDVLADKTISVISSSDMQLEKLFSSKKISDLMEKIRSTKHKIRKTNSGSMYKTIDNFLECLEFLVDANVLSTPVPQKLVFELKLLRCITRFPEPWITWYSSSTGTQIDTEEKVRTAWWNLRSHYFRTSSTKKIYFLPLCSELLEAVIIPSPEAEKLLLNLVYTLIDSLMAYMKPFISVENTTYQDIVHFEALKRELIVLRCILLDPLKQYAAEEELDELFQDIKAAATVAGTLLVKRFEENIHVSAVETVECCKAAVRQAYLKFAKLTPSKLPKSELGRFDLLLELLLELKNGEANSPAISGHQMAELLKDLSICSSFLSDKEVESSRLDDVEYLRAQIINMRCKVDNVIDSFEEVPDWFFNMRLSDVREELCLITKEITKIYPTKKFGVSLHSAIETNDVMESEDKATTSTDKEETAEHHEGEANDPETEAEQTSAFEDEENLLLSKLTEGTEELEIISIVGMPGLGKTTLAMEVYRSCMEGFDVYAWCHVSPDPKKKELLLQILSNIQKKSRSELEKLEPDDLAQQVHAILDDKSYLIVLDDIWDIKTWFQLKACFPPGNKMSRILLTSRFKLIGSQASENTSCIELKPLSKDKSWNLLKMMVLGEEMLPANLHAVGYSIAEECGGLPLSLSVIAGVLKNKGRTKPEWEQVANDLGSIVISRDGVRNILELSYRDLTYSMKQCFLYCGAFLKGKEIPRSKLVWLWSAERFIKVSDQQKNLEDTAENYLSQLVNKSLLTVTKRSSDDRIRSCTIHDLLRDFCLQKAEEEKFLLTMNRWNVSPSWQRRISFLSTEEDFSDFRNSLSSIPRIRTVIFSVPNTRVDGPTIIPYIIKNCRLLNVLDLESVLVDDHFPEKLTTLDHLNYLAVQLRVGYIPESIVKLQNIETLIIKGITEEILIPHVVFALKKIKHLIVKNRAQIKGGTIHSPSQSLQTFSTPAIYSSTAKDVVGMLTELRKLRCIFLDSWNESINANVLPDLSCLSHLDSLKVYYHGWIRRPYKFSFPSNLRKLTLSKTQFLWSSMETIGKQLPKLEVLKLLHKAFTGTKWETSATFSALKYLRFDTLDIEEWEASDSHFPKLERLVIQRCKQLQIIPSDFSYITEIKSIEVNWCSRSLAKSASIIGTQRKNSGVEHFKTTIYPRELDLDDDLSD